MQSFRSLNCTRLATTNDSAVAVSVCSLSMEPDRASNSGDNLTAAREFLTRAAMQLDQASTRRGAGKGYMQ